MARFRLASGSVFPQWSLRPHPTMARQHVPGAITTITLTPVPPMVITDPAGSSAASSSAPDPGTDGVAAPMPTRIMAMDMERATTEVTAAVITPLMDTTAVVATLEVEEPTQVAGIMQAAAVTQRRTAALQGTLTALPAAIAAASATDSAAVSAAACAEGLEAVPAAEVAASAVEVAEVAVAAVAVADF